MNHSALRLLGLSLLLLGAGGTFAPAAQPPGPGLEILDSGAGIDRGADAPAISTQPTGPGVSQPYPASDPAQPVYVPNAAPGLAPAAVDAATETAAPPPGQAIYPANAAADALANLNVRNPVFPGLAEAVKQNSLKAAADIIWQTLRQRRIVNNALLLGPGGSAGTVQAFESQQVFAAIKYQPSAALTDGPLDAARRINIILNAFAEPMIDDYAFGGVMEEALIRLYADIYAVRVAMPETVNDAVWQELVRTYIRAATTCDFFIFTRKDLTQEAVNIAVRASPQFYPDGSSIAGDVGGVSGNLLLALDNLDFYSRDDSWFRRDLAPFWRVMEKPARYAAALAYPDSTLPRFGPRGARELGPTEVIRLREMFPASSLDTVRIGLAASQSFPSSSDEKSYGGIFASRSSFDANARYLAVRFGPMGIMDGVPSHRDFGSLTLMSRNIRFIVDPGGYGGAAAGAAVHSALSLNGEYVLPDSYGTPGEPADAIWHTNASLDYAAGRALFADGKAWQRAVLYIKDLPGETRSDYWLVLDQVEMNGDNRPQQALIRYQLAPGLQVYHDGSGVVANAGYGDGSSLRFFAVDANAEMTVSEGVFGLHPSQVFDVAGGIYAAPAVTVARTLTGDGVTSTLLYPGPDMNHKPARIERDSDLITGRTGALVIDHGDGRIDVIAWSPPGQELVTPTLNLQMSADLGVFRIRNGKIVRMNFINLERFQAKEPNGGLWSARVSGKPQTLTFEPEQNGGWQVLSDPANPTGASLYEVNLGPAISNRKVSLRVGELRPILR